MTGVQRRAEAAAQARIDVNPDRSWAESVSAKLSRLPGAVMFDPRVETLGEQSLRRNPGSRTGAALLEAAVPSPLSLVPGAWVGKLSQLGETGSKLRTLSKATSLAINGMGVGVEWEPLQVARLIKNGLVPIAGEIAQHFPSLRPKMATQISHPPGSGASVPVATPSSPIVAPPPSSSGLSRTVLESDTYTLDTEKYRYFFGQVEKPPAPPVKPPQSLQQNDPAQFQVELTSYNNALKEHTRLKHNYDRSQQLKQVLEANGMGDTDTGRQKLNALFGQASTAHPVASHVGDYGTTVTRAVEMDGVRYEVKFFHEGGDLTTKPKVVSLIPKS